MKRVLWLCPAILVCCANAQAQSREASSTPQWELSGGYSFLKANFGGSGTSFNLNGGGAAIGENINNWFGGRFEVNAFGGSVGGTNVSAQTFTFGPVISYRKFTRFTPHGTVQIGSMHASPGYLGISMSAFKFAIASGGGVDLRINRQAAVRFQGEYLMSRFLGLRQDNLQFSTGVVIYLGRK
jgi:Outer membrane protein beta-barrel domain